MDRASELMMAIRAKCLDCSGGSRKMVKGCTVRDCPLWVYRTHEAETRQRTPRGQIYIFDVLEDKRA